MTEKESQILAIIAREGPTTAYKVRKILERSPELGISASQAIVYPVVARLKRDGYVSSIPRGTDRRNTELLFTTPKGRAAVRRWVKRISAEQLLPSDALRTRIANADMLGPGELVAWLRKTSNMLSRQLREIEARAGNHDDDAVGYSLQYARMITAARLELINDILRMKTLSTEGK